MSIQITQPAFTGRIESLRHVDTKKKGRIFFRPITQEENKLLRPLINYLKHYCEGVHSIQIQDDPIVISMYSEYTPKHKIGNSDRFVRQSSIISKKLNKNDIQHLLDKAKENAIYFKDIKAKEKALLSAETEPKKKKSFFSRMFSFFN